MTRTVAWLATGGAWVVTSALVTRLVAPPVRLHRHSLMRSPSVKVRGRDVLLGILTGVLFAGWWAFVALWGKQ